MGIPLTHKKFVFHIVKNVPLPPLVQLVWTLFLSQRVGLVLVVTWNVVLVRWFQAIAQVVLRSTTT